LILAVIALGCGLLLWGWLEARSHPLVRRAAFSLPGWPERASPLKAVLISDIHVAGPDMPPARLAKIVTQINALQPDLVLIAGDLVSDKGIATRLYSMAEAIAPLAGLTPKLGAFAVLGNHDHWRDADAARAALRRAGIRVLDNEAVRAGPLVIAGADDVYTGHDDPAALTRAAERLGGPVLVLSHSPDIVPELDPRFRLVLAGHTHCGQIVPPLIGRLATASHYGERYACGIVRENGRAIVVSAGLGTSLLPLRMGARPDMWLLELGPARPAAAR
jgi:predicted MPP superfamily phosphohydrolase